jgi:hypothetical protein
VCFEFHAGDMTKLLVLGLLVLAAVLTYAGTYEFTACQKDGRLAALQR